MKRALFLACWLAIPMLARAQGGIIGVYADPSGTNCELNELAGTTVSIYVIHDYTVGSTGSRFRVVESPGVTMTYVDETAHFATTFGDTRNGATVCYGACLVGPIVVFTMHYLAHGTSTPCSFVEPAPHPTTDQMEVLDCDSKPNGYSVLCRRLLVNPRLPSCVCGIDADRCSDPYFAYPGGPLSFCTVAIEDETWGAIKALFEI